MIKRLFSIVEPSIPLGLEASHLSATQIQLKWNPPDEPNGIMTGYKIYYRKSTYLFWKNDIDWCKRDLDSAVVTEKENENNNVNTTVGINGEYIFSVKLHVKCKLMHKNTQTLEFIFLLL